MEEKDYSGTWNIRFTCPHCKKEAGIYEEEYCPARNKILSFEVNAWGEDEVGNLCGADDVDIDYGPTDIGEPDMAHQTYYCDNCDEVIDDTLCDKEDLFNWLFEKGMVKQSATESE